MWRSRCSRLTAAGVRVVDGGLGAAVSDRVFLAVVVGLVVGKPVGVLFGTWVTARFTRAELDESLDRNDVAGVALLSGVGFTVSLLLGELSFGMGSDRQDHVKLAVLTGSLLAGVLAAVVAAAAQPAPSRASGGLTAVPAHHRPPGPRTNATPCPPGGHDVTSCPTGAWSP